MRPALVLANAGRDDYILAQITSRPYASPLSVKITNSDFASGTLQRVSYVRPGKLFTANSQLIAEQIGQLKTDAFEPILDAVVALLRRGDVAAPGVDQTALPAEEDKQENGDSMTSAPQA